MCSYLFFCARSFRDIVLIDERRYALVERGHDRRPDEFHREPDQDQKDNDLDYEGSGNAHVESFM